MALARAFVRQAPIIILDEPTSFMDSWAEVEWLRRFRALAQGRTALIITHRFTTAMRADVIHARAATTSFWPAEVSVLSRGQPRPKHVWEH